MGAPLATRIGRISTIVYGSTKVGAQRTTRFWRVAGYGHIPVCVADKAGDGTLVTLEAESAKRE